MTAITQQISQHHLHSWELGVLLACYNLALIVAIVLVTMLSFNSNQIWAYALLASPVLYTLFWLWFTQVVFRHYRHLSIHDALLVAKIGTFPFLLVFLFCVIGLTFALYGEVVPAWWASVTYYGTMFSFSTIFLSLTVVVFGLRHNIRLPILKG